MQHEANTVDEMRVLIDSGKIDVGDTVLVPDRLLPQWLNLVRLPNKQFRPIKNPTLKTLQRILT